MKDEFRKRFSVEVAPEEVWPALARKTDDHGQSASDSPPGTQVWLPGWEMTGEVLEVEPGRRLLLRKDAQPCKGTEILVELEHEGSGTVVTVVKSGFGAFFEAALKYLSIGADCIFADLALYLETGVLGHRHMNAWAVGLGADTQGTPGGLVVTRVQAGGFAERAGLQPGDRLLELAGASLTCTRDLTIALGTQRGVKETSLAWVRGREKHRSSASF